MPDFSFLNDGDDDGTVRIDTGRTGKKRSAAAAKSRQSWDAVRTVLAWVMMAWIVGGCWRWIGSLPQQTDAAFAAADNRTLAVLNAQTHIKSMLRSPRSAKWPGAFSGVNIADHATKRRDGTYLVHSWVDADNAFGASIRTWYKVHLRVRKDGNADVLAAELLE